MLPLILTTVSLLLASSTTAEPHDAPCRIVLDGRVPKTANAQTFDNPIKSPFQNTYARPADTKWAQVITFPSVPPSVFDLKDGGRPIQVNINDKSIYDEQRALRRAGLVINGKVGAEVEAITGIKTFHWSVRQPSGGKDRLNFTHEYQNVFLVNKDDDEFTFKFGIGNLIAWGNKQPVPPTYWKIINRKNEGVFSTDIDWREWQNFAVQLDFNKNTMQIFYSKGSNKLAPVSEALPNENRGGILNRAARFHVGVLKKPTGVAKDTEIFRGHQERDFQESQIYGGIFVEDSAKGCITT